MWASPGARAAYASQERAHSAARQPHEVWSGSGTDGETEARREEFACPVSRGSLIRRVRVHTLPRWILIFELLVTIPFFLKMYFTCRKIHPRIVYS